YAVGSFGFGVPFPKTEHIAFSILAEGKVAHASHRGFAQKDLSTKFFDFSPEIIHRWHVHVTDHSLLPMVPLHQAAIGSVIPAARVDMPVLHGAWELLDFPTKERAIKRLRPFDIVCRNFKPHEARRLPFAFRFCYHNLLFC